MALSSRTGCSSPTSFEPVTPLFTSSFNHSLNVPRGTFPLIDMKSRLGRGLSSLISEREQTSETHPSELELRLIRPNPFQPRTEFDPEDLEDLRRSILNHGILQPVVVRTARGGYELISGERRWRASRMAGLATVPAIVRQEVSDDDMLELAIVENVQRQDLNPMERARGYQALIDRLGLTQEGVASRVGLRRSTVTNHLRLLELPDEVQDLLSAGRLTMGHARALLSLKDPDQQRRLLSELLQENWSVRDTEEEVRQIVAAKAEPKSSEVIVESVAQPPAWVADMERRLQERFGTRCRVVLQGAEKGHISIDFFERQDIDRIHELLLPDAGV